MDHATRFPTNRPASVYPQTATMRASDFISRDSQLAENPGTAEQNASVRSMLLANIDRANIRSIVQTHKDSKQAGLHHMLDHLSKLTKEQFDQAISTNGSQTAPMLAFNFISRVSQLVENPGQNASVHSTMLAKRILTNIHLMVQTYKDSKQAGFYHELDHLSKLTEKQLDQVISANGE